MTPHDVRVPGARRITARRFALLASVAAIGAGVLLAGPGGFDRMSFAATSRRCRRPRPRIRPASPIWSPR